MKKHLRYLSLIPTLLLFLIVPTAHAASLTYQANETWDASSCTFSVNGSPLLYDPAENGDTINIVVTDNTPSSTDFLMNVNFTGDANHGGTQGPYNIGPGQSVTVAFSNIQSNSFVYISGGDCSSNNTTDSYLWVKPATATLACTTVPSGKAYAWDVTGNYTNMLSGAIYNGSSSDGTTGGGNGSINETYAAGSSPATFYFYDGNNSSGRLLAQANCAAGSYPTASTPSATTPKSTTTTPTTGSTTPATSTTSSSSATTSTTPTTTSTTSTDGKKTVPTQKVSSRNTALLVGGGISLLIILLAILALGVLGVWNAPQRLVRRVWKALNRIFRKGTPLTPPTQTSSS